MRNIYITNAIKLSLAAAHPSPPRRVPGHYIDKKCPFTGNVSIRGRILSGACHPREMSRRGLPAPRADARMHSQSQALSGPPR